MMERVELDVTRFDLGVKCSHVAFETHRDDIMHELMVTMRYHMTGENQEPFCYKVPASWWQHFKQDCFPHWLLNQFSAEYITVTVPLSVIYPHIKCSLPKKYMGDRILIMVHNSPAKYYFDPNEPVPVFDTRATKKPL